MDINVVESGYRKLGTNFLSIFSDSFQKNEFLKKFMAVEVFHCTKQY